MGFIYFPHGAIMEQWTPAAEGTNFELTPILKPLAPFQKQLTIVSGLENKPAIAPPVHALSPGHLAELRDAARRPGAVRRRHRRSDRRRSTSARTRRCRRSKSRPRGRGGGGACDRNYGCSYGGTISFRTPTTPLPMEADPRKLFERLFGQGDTPQERKAHREAVREHARPGVAARPRICSSTLGAAGPRDARRLSRKRARDRAARPEDGSAGSVAARPAGRAGRHPHASTSA